MTAAALPAVSLVVPTMALSPYLGECLDRLRTTGGRTTEIIVVAQGELADGLDLPQADLVVRRRESLGFAAACNLGVASGSTPYVGLVNDDALVEPDWLSALIGVLERNPDVAAAQGVNLQLADPERIDGCGIGWNWSWRPVQLGYGASTRSAPGSRAVREIFGVSATACVFRRSALEATALEPGVTFEPALRSYFEDVELAVRLRHGGFRALLVEAARARHAGSVTSRQFPEEHQMLLTSNRYLVAARLFGRDRRQRTWRLRLRDIVEMLSALASGRFGTFRGVLSGWRRAHRWLPRFAHAGPPALAGSELAVFRIRRARDFR